MAKDKKPKNFGVGDLRVEAMRRPANAAPDEWYWRAVRYEAGQAHQQWSGRGTRAEVTRAIADVVARGETTPTKRPKKGDRVDVVRDVLELHVGALEVREEQGTASAQTVNTRRRVGRHLTRRIGDVPLRDLDQLTVDGYVARRLREGAASSSIDLELRELRQALTWARKRKLAPLIEFDFPPLPKQEPRRNRTTPTRDEAAAMLAHLPVDRWPYLAARLILGLGARLGEVAQLRWGEIDLWAEGEAWAGMAALHGAGMVGRQRRTGKTGAREVAIPGDLAAILAACRPERAHPSDRVLPVAASTVVAQLREHIAAACDVAEVPRWSPNGARRSASETVLSFPDVDLLAYKAQFGHSPETALKHYARARYPAQAGMAEGLTLDTDPHNSTRTGEIDMKKKPGGSSEPPGLGGSPKGNPWPSKKQDAP